MKLGYFAMPMHPLGRTWSETLTEDREAVMIADRLGFHDAFIGEHLTDRFETIVNSLVFLATLIPETSQIKLATGTTNLSHTHPVLVALQSAMFDHMSGGRFILGVSPGALPSDAEILGMLDEDRNQLFAESIEIITRMWESEAPYDIELPGNRFKVSTARTLNPELGIGYAPTPLQTPRPEIVGTVVAPYSKGVVAMGAKDFHPLSANFLLPQWVATHWGKYAEGKESVGAEARRDDWRIARTIFVSADDRVARDYAFDSIGSPYRFYYNQMLNKMKLAGRLGLFKTDQDQSDDDVTLENVMNHLVIAGTPASVAEQLHELREVTGDFGELVYAGLDWADRDLAIRSMELMAEQVMPMLNGEFIESAAVPSAAGTA